MMENREKLIRQLFVGKVSETLGLDKTLELLKEANDVFRCPKCKCKSLVKYRDGKQCSFCLHIV